MSKRKLQQDDEPISIGSTRQPIKEKVTEQSQKALESFFNDGKKADPVDDDHHKEETKARKKSVKKNATMEEPENADKPERKLRLKKIKDTEAD